jgi:pyrroline-5-carboxylate reductase
MKIGFIGTGAITTAMVEGLCQADHLPAGIVVSPRNMKKAEKLAARFDNVRIAGNNQAVADECDCVVLAVIPQIAQSVLGELHFRRKQKIISVIAIKLISEIKSLADPATDIIRAIPLPTVARRMGPIAFFPYTSWADNLFRDIGDPIAVTDENELGIIAAVTALIAPYYALMESVCRWGVASGMGSKASGNYVGSMFQALSVLAREASADCFENLSAESSTPGGLNEQALKEIRKQEGFDTFTKALDVVLARLKDKSVGY